MLNNEDGLTMHDAEGNHTKQIPAAGQDDLQDLYKAVNEKSLSLFLGAGVSVGSGLPSWETLIASTFFQILGTFTDPKTQSKPYPNYLYAAAEHYVKTSGQPLEVLAQAVVTAYKSPKAHIKSHPDGFLGLLRETLYLGFSSNTQDKLTNNATLQSVAKLCNSTIASNVVTYNYDNLLEIVLNGNKCQPYWKPTDIDRSKLPIYHVHGYIPQNGIGSDESEIILTEQQFHNATHDLYSWSNLVQLNALSHSVVLMVGMSLSDRNVRRLLDALRRNNLGCKAYILVKTPTYKPTEYDIEVISQKADTYLGKFNNSGTKAEDKRVDQIRSIYKRLDSRGQEMRRRAYIEMGVYPIYREDYNSMVQFLDKLPTEAKKNKQKSP